jgi:PilZ domain
VAKRKGTRVAVERRVEYRHAGGQGQGMLTDLSMQGCRIKGACCLSCGARLRLQIWLPDQAEPVMIERSVVRWIAEDQFGVSFLEVPSDVAVRLTQVFQTLQKEQQTTGQVIPVAATFLATKEQNAAWSSPEVRVGR